MLDTAQAARVATAVKAAEAGTDGEIATVIAPRSDGYADVALWWAAAAALLVAAALATWPQAIHRLRALAGSGWEDAVSEQALLTALLAATAAAYLAAWALVRYTALLGLLTPASVKTDRVRHAALTAFRLGTEGRTARANGVLVYVSVAEHRAEIVADAGIHAAVPPATWGAAMAALLGGLKAGRPDDGFVAAIEQVGTVLAAHFPRTGSDPNEMPDHLVIL